MFDLQVSMIKEERNDNIMIACFSKKWINILMTKVKSVVKVLQYKSYLQLIITKFTGHKITMKKTKCQVKFTIQVFGQEKTSTYTSYKKLGNLF